MHIYQAINTFLQSHNQLQNKNIHINFLFFQLKANAVITFSGQITQMLETQGDAGDSFTK